MSKRTLNLELPDKLGFLFEPHRYKVAHGGRGGTKSWGFARALLTKGTIKPIRVLCARELQKSLKESVHSLLVQQADMLGMGQFYTATESVIRGANGTEFLFEGIWRNVDSIKSMEGIDICWVEEAEKVTDESWSVLIPTIRKPGSEIWVTFNPSDDHDPAWQRFVVSPPPDCVTVEINWSDNPWITPELIAEKDHLKATDYEKYLHVWEGKFLRFKDGSIYRDQLLQAEDQGRITSVPVEPTVPIFCVFDLGMNDATAIWFIQVVGLEVRIVDYYESSGESLNHYANEIDKRSKTWGVRVGDLILPHDAKVRELGTGKSRMEVLQSLGFSCRVAPNIPLADGIEATKQLIKRCWFDAVRCEPGLHCLRNYEREYNEDRRVYYDRPLHNWASHAADALRYWAVGEDQVSNGHWGEIEYPSLGII